MNKTLTPQTKDWQEKFDEFSKKCFIGFSDDGEFNLYLSGIDEDAQIEIKSFITDLLKDAVEAERERIESLIPETVEIVKDHENRYRFDEAWCPWYECPKCHENNISYSKYCPDCGVMIKWLPDKPEAIEIMQEAVKGK